MIHWRLFIFSAILFKAVFILDATTSDGWSSLSNQIKAIITPCGTSFNDWDRICLFRRYDSRICRLTRFRLTARLKQRLGTLIRIRAEESSFSEPASIYTTRKGKIEKDFPLPSKSRLTSERLYTRSVLCKVMLPVFITE